MKERCPWWQRLDDWLALSAFWNEHSLMICVRAASLFSLPIEGGFWLSVMGERWAFFAYALPFVLDWLADRLVYEYTRIQLTVRKGEKKWQKSRSILWFVLFNAVQSWGTSAWQLNGIMRSNGDKAFWLFPLLFATIQPVMGYGAARAKAVRDGKFDEQERPKTEQERPKTEQKPPKRIQGQPKYEWWQDKVRSMDGQATPFTVQDLMEMIQAEYTDMPSATTLYSWVKEARSET